VRWCSFGDRRRYQQQYLGFTQGGSNADIVVTDAYLKNISEGIDWNLAYEAVIKDAEVEPPNWDVEGAYLSSSPYPQSN
jgi:putative alpha-1,2-mannosidase